MRRSWLDIQINDRKAFRRILLVWGCAMFTIMSFRLTSPEAIAGMSAAAASVGVAVLGVLATSITFYQWSRDKDDKRSGGTDRPD